MKKPRHKKQAKKANKSTLARDLGIDRGTLRGWEKLGAPIADGADAVVEWALKNDRRAFEPEELRAARIGVLLETQRKLKLANDERDGKLVAADLVTSGIQIAVTTFWSEVQRITRDFPSLLEGLSAAEMRQKFEAH